MDRHFGPNFKQGSLDHQIGPNFEIGIHGPPFWSEFLKRDAGIHGPPSWSEFLKRDAGIHGPPSWSDFLKRDAFIYISNNLFEKQSSMNSVHTTLRFLIRIF